MPGHSDICHAFSIRGLDLKAVGFLGPDPRLLGLEELACSRDEVFARTTKGSKPKGRLLTPEERGVLLANLGDLLKELPEKLRPFSLIVGRQSPDWPEGTSSLSYNQHSGRWDTYWSANDLPCSNRSLVLLHNL